MIKITNKKVRKFIVENGAKLHSSNATHSFYKKGHIIISIPKDGDLKYAHMEAIATEQLSVAWPPADFKKSFSTKTDATIQK